MPIIVSLISRRRKKNVRNQQTKSTEAHTAILLFFPFALVILILIVSGGRILTLPGDVFGGKF